MMKKESRLPRFLSQNEAARLVSAPDGSDELKLRDRALLEVIYAAGLRVSEVRDLNVNDINFERRSFAFAGRARSSESSLSAKRRTERCTVTFTRSVRSW